MARVIELTPRGRGAVSVLLVRGADARAAVERLAGRALAPPERGPRLVRLAVGGAALDVALAVDRGAAGIELHVHGSPGLVRALARALGGVEPDAGGSEAGRRGRPIEDEALDLLSRAPSEAAARVLLDQAEGALRRALARLACAAPDAWRAGLAELDRRGALLERLVRPPRVVLAGPVNAGKSTLFNALLGRERVVASDEEGTTRDAIVEPAQLGAYAVELVDVAGERALGSDAGADAVERAGQELAREHRRAADLVLWLAPPGAPAPPADLGPPVGSRPPAAGADPGPGPWCVRLAARGDRPDAEPGALRPVEDPAGARHAVERAFHAALALPAAPWTPGAAAPPPSIRAALAALADATAAQDRAFRIAELLGPPPLGSAAPAS